MAAIPVESSKFRGEEIAREIYYGIRWVCIRYCQIVGFAYLLIALMLKADIRCGAEFVRWVLVQLVQRPINWLQ